MIFRPGDRVRVVGGPSAKYFGGEGVVVSSTSQGGSTRVSPDMEFQRQMGHIPTNNPIAWSFSKRWVLELVDDSAAYVPEDWS